LSKAKILIVEDEFVVANDLRLRLENMGYIITAAVASGERAIQKIESEKPDLILMDIMLRGEMDGIEAANHINLRFNIPVIFLTAHADQKIIERAKRTEPFGYIIKPAEDRELESAIEVALYKVQMESYRSQVKEEMLKVKKLESMAVFAGGIAHDYNNLLTAIIGYISLAQIQTQPGDKIFRLLSEAEKASMRARDLTKKLSAFYRNDSLLKRPALILPLLKSLIKFTLKDSNIRSELIIPDDIWVCDIDEIRISDAIHNIIINAKESMPLGGAIRITAHNIIVDNKKDCSSPLHIRNGKYIRISVADQGIGIPESHFEKIFDPYFSTKERGSQKGMGLGLTISHSTVKRHNGYIEVESEVGRGTTFHIYLPASENEILKKDDEEIIVDNDKNFPDICKGHILIMDDEEIIRDVACQILEHLGYDPKFAEDGEEAIEMYEKAEKSGYPFDIVIVDLVVPNGMGGRETIERLKKIDPHVRAVVSSGYVNDPVMTDFKEYGFIAAVAKPYKINEISTILHQVMDK